MPRLRQRKQGDKAVATDSPTSTRSTRRTSARHANSTSESAPPVEVPEAEELVKKDEDDIEDDPELVTTEDKGGGEGGGDTGDQESAAQSKESTDQGSTGTDALTNKSPQTISADDTDKYEEENEANDDISDKYEEENEANDEISDKYEEANEANDEISDKYEEANEEISDKCEEENVANDGISDKYEGENEANEEISDKCAENAEVDGQISGEVEDSSIEVLEPESSENKDEVTEDAVMPEESDKSTITIEDDDTGAQNAEDDSITIEDNDGDVGLDGEASTQQKDGAAAEADLALTNSSEHSHGDVDGAQEKKEGEVMEEGDAVAMAACEDGDGWNMDTSDDFLTGDGISEAEQPVSMETDGGTVDDDDSTAGDSVTIEDNDEVEEESEAEEEEEGKVLSPEYSEKPKSISYLLVPCRHLSPGHQQVQMLVISCSGLGLEQMESLPSTQVICAEGETIGDLINMLNADSYLLAGYDVILFQLSYRGLTMHDPDFDFRDPSGFVEHTEKELKNLLSVASDKNSDADLHIGACLPISGDESKEDKEPARIIKVNDLLEEIAWKISTTVLPVHTHFLTWGGAMEDYYFTYKDQVGYHLNGKGVEKLQHIYSQFYEARKIAYFEKMKEKNKKADWSCLLVMNRTGFDLEEASAIPTLEKVTLRDVPDDGIAGLVKEFQEDSSLLDGYDMIIFHLCHASCLEDQEKADAARTHVQEMLEVARKHNSTAELAVTSMLPVRCAENPGEKAIKNFNVTLMRMAISHGATFLTFYDRFQNVGLTSTYSRFYKADTPMILNRNGMLKVQHLYQQIVAKMRDNTIEEDIKYIGANRKCFLPSVSDMQRELKTWQRMTCVTVFPFLSADLYKEGMQEIMKNVRLLRTRGSSEHSKQPAIGDLRIAYHSIPEAVAAAAKLKEMFPQSSVLHLGEEKKIESAVKSARKQVPFNELHKYMLLVYGIPEDVEEEDIKKAYPTALQVYLTQHLNTLTKQCFAYVYFDTVEEMEQKVAEGWCCIGEHEYEVMPLQNWMDAEKLRQKLDSIPRSDWVKHVEKDSADYKELKKLLQLVMYHLCWRENPTPHRAVLSQYAQKLENRLTKDFSRCPKLRKKQLEKIRSSDKKQQQSGSVPSNAKRKGGEPQQPQEVKRQRHTPARSKGIPHASTASAAQAAPVGMSVPVSCVHGPGLHPVYASYIPQFGVHPFGPAVRMGIPYPHGPGLVSPLGVRTPNAMTMRPPNTMTMRSQNSMSVRGQSSVAMGSQQTVAMQSPGGVAVQSKKTMTVQSPGGVAVQSHVVNTVQWQGGPSGVSTVQQQMASTPNVRGMWPRQGYPQARRPAPGGARQGGARPGGVDAVRAITGLVKLMHNQSNARTGSASSNTPTSSGAYVRGPSPYHNNQGAYGPRNGPGSWPQYRR